ncbi:MAG TPA: ABC transporter substrate-binding protein [Chloroflexota bacterium]|nr:ABC transporter substrate-binding protein [Chloroflexota bacterium]
MQAGMGWRGGCRVLVLLGSLLAACAAPGAPASPASAPPGGAPSAGAASATAAPAPPVRVRAAYVSIASNMLPAWIDVDEGLYQKYGLDVELSYIAGAAKISEAVMAGELDFGVAPASSAIGPGLEGADTVMLASWTNKLSLARPKRCGSTVA